MENNDQMFLELINIANSRGCKVEYYEGDYLDRTSIKVNDKFIGCEEDLLLFNHEFAKVIFSKISCCHECGDYKEKYHGLKTGHGYHLENWQYNLKRLVLEKQNNRIKYVWENMSY